jgi:hypothetical protein
VPAKHPHSRASKEGRGVFWKINLSLKREDFQTSKGVPEIKKALLGSEFWCDWGYIGTVGDGILSDIILNYVETQGTTEEKEGFKQMNLLEFDYLADAPRMPHSLLWGAPSQFD